MISQTPVPRTIGGIVAVVSAMQLAQVVPAHVIVEVEMPPAAVIKSDAPMWSCESILTVDAERLEEWLFVFLLRPVQMPKRQPFDGYGDATNRLPTESVPVEQADQRTVDQHRPTEMIEISHFNSFNARLDSMLFQDTSRAELCPIWPQSAMNT